MGWKVVAQSFDSLLHDRGQKTQHSLIPDLNPQGFVESEQVSILGTRLVIVPVWGATGREYNLLLEPLVRNLLC